VRSISHRAFCGSHQVISCPAMKGCRLYRAGSHAHDRAAGHQMQMMTG
jgi:hypothetical protein